ncbi:hypothetical protein OfM1_08970 [Lactovum odontotermitis]
MKMNLKNKILVALVCLGAVGTTAAQLTASADAPETRVWVGQVKDYRYKETWKGVTQKDNTYYKELRCSHGYEELPVYHSHDSYGNLETEYWKWNYRTF